VKDLFIEAGNESGCDCKVAFQYAFLRISHLGVFLELIIVFQETPKSSNLSIFDSQANPQPVLAYAMGVCESVIGIMALSLIIVLEDLAPNSVARVR
jgi:hypothetical protein